jgi:serine phosphatase RsbU (regulator of sigma subunit)
VGLRGQMNTFSAKIESELDRVDEKISFRVEALIYRIQVQIILLIIFCVFLNILLAITIYRKLNRPVKYLSKSIHEIIKSDFDEKIELYEYGSNDEIGRLAKDFKFMVSNLRTKSRALKESNVELLQQQEEIIAQKDNIETINKQIIKVNNDMTASINYAKRIQNALLAFDKKMDHAFPQHFIFFRPRDIVSGDFYWFAEKEDKAIIAAVDCTGHGVPGALMSMIGSTLLNQIVHDREIHEPHLILNELHKGVWQTLRQESNEIKDGMDVSLCVVNTKDKLLSFAGARHSLLIMQNNEYQLVAGDKMSIGESADYYYTCYDFDLQTSIMCYLFSDGCTDQFGGAQDRKFSIRQLKELLFSVHTQDLGVQKEMIEEKINHWQGLQKQTDDILLIGFRV